MTQKPVPDIIGNLWKVWKTKTGFEALTQESAANKAQGIR